MANGRSEDPENETATCTTRARSSFIAVFSALGALLFGIDIGYIAPILDCKSFKKDVARLKDWDTQGSTLPSADAGFVVGIFSIGSVVTAFPVVSGYFLERWGRRDSIVIGSAIFIVGSILQATSSSMTQMLTGRFITGASIGLLSSVVALYQSELAPPDMRGALTSVYQLMITLGILLAAALDLFLVDEPDGWRWAIWIQLLPAGALCCGMCFMPRSPRWLVQQGTEKAVEEAQKVLDKLRPPGQASAELEEIVQSHREATKHGELLWIEMLRGRTFRLVGVAVSLQLLQQLVGMNAFMYFGPRIFASLGLPRNKFQTLNNAVNFLSTFPALYLADNYGRRALLLASATGMLVSCTLVGLVGSIFMERVDNTWQSTNEKAGYFIAAMVFFFVFNFAYGWGPIVWVYCAEMFELKYRARGVGLATTANWIGNYLIAQLTPMLLEGLGFGTFFVFAFFCVLALLLALWLPEPRGVMLERINELWDTKFAADCQDPPIGKSNIGLQTGEADDDIVDSTEHNRLKP